MLEKVKNALRAVWEHVPKGKGKAPDAFPKVCKHSGSYNRRQHYYI